MPRRPFLVVRRAAVLEKKISNDRKCLWPPRRSVRGRRKPPAAEPQAAQYISAVVVQWRHCHWLCPTVHTKYAKRRLNDSTSTTYGYNACGVFWTTFAELYIEYWKTSIFFRESGPDNSKRMADRDGEHHDARARRHVRRAGRRGVRWGVARAIRTPLVIFCMQNH